MEEMTRPPFRRTVFICCNEREEGENACANRGSRDLQKELKAFVKERGLQKKIRISRAMCLGICDIGPNIFIQPENVWLNDVQKDDLPFLIDKWITPIEKEEA